MRINVKNGVGTNAVRTNAFRTIFVRTNVVGTGDVQTNDLGIMVLEQMYCCCQNKIFQLIVGKKCCLSKCHEFKSLGTILSTKSFIFNQ